MHLRLFVGLGPSLYNHPISQAIVDATAWCTHVYITTGGVTDHPTRLDDLECQSTPSDRYVRLVCHHHAELILPKQRFWTIKQTFGNGVFEVVFKGASARFAQRPFEKCFEKTFPQYTTDRLFRLVDSAPWVRMTLIRKNSKPKRRIESVRAIVL